MKTLTDRPWFPDIEDDEMYFRILPDPVDKEGRLHFEIFWKSKYIMEDIYNPYPSRNRGQNFHAQIEPHLTRALDRGMKVTVGMLDSGDTRFNYSAFLKEYHENASAI